MLISGSSSITSGQGSAGLPTALSFPPDRQDHTEAAPPAGCALDLDPPTVVGDEAVADRQPQARPLADRLGREERVEYPRQDLLRDAAAVVRQLQNHLVAPRPGLDLDPPGAPPRGLDRLHGVDQEIQDHLVDLRRAQTTGSTPPSCCSTVMWRRSNWPRIISRLPAIACCRSTRSTAA